MLLSGAAFPNDNDTAYRVVGSSMAPTLQHGDVIRVETDYFTSRPLERGLIIAVRLRTRKTPMVKRMVAVAGDKVGVLGSQITVGETRYPLSRRGAMLLARQLERYGSRVPPDHFIALGDNPAASFDSASFGLLSRRQLLGRVRLVTPRDR